MGLQTGFVTPTKPPSLSAAAAPRCREKPGWVGGGGGLPMRGDALAIKNSERVGGGKRREDEEEEEEEEEGGKKAPEYL